jgi:Kef-type K+ transport system membrane component KefB
VLAEVISNNIWYVAAAWMGLALLASLVSIRLGVSVALIEIGMGVIGGNFLGFQTTPWIDFLASFGSVLLTFLAGAEIEPHVLKRHLKPTLVIGTLAFFAPFLAAWMFALRIVGWEPHAAQIAGIALSTTSVAVVYAVLVETGLNETELGKIVLAACFTNDLGTVLALGVLFANFNAFMAVFVGVLVLTLVFLPRTMRLVIARLGNRVSEPEVKFLFLVLFVLGGLASSAKSEAVLPAYLVGLVVAGVFTHDKVLVHRIRSTAFALLTPFYFLKAGLFVSLPAVTAGAGLIVAFLAVKMGAKAVTVWPSCRAFDFSLRNTNYTTMLMSTGLTFGSISALFGLTNHIIDQTQYTILVTVVILSAIVPTLIAQTFFEPHVRPTKEQIELASELAPEDGAAGVLVRD